MTFGYLYWIVSLGMVVKKDSHEQSQVGLPRLRDVDANLNIVKGANMAPPALLGPDFYEPKGK